MGRENPSGRIAFQPRITDVSARVFPIQGVHLTHESAGRFMMFSRLRYFLPAGLLLCAAAYAQPFSGRVMLMPDVLSPAPRTAWIGPLAGVNLNTHTGEFVPELCKECEFTGGDGTGIVVGVEYGRKLNNSFGFAIKGMYDDKQALFKKPLPNVTRVVYDPQTQQSSSAQINTERSATIALSYLVLNPVVQFFPFGDFYLMAGPGIGVGINSKYTLKERIVDEGYTYNENGEVEVTLETDTEIAEAESVRFDLRAGAGYNIRLSETVMLAPEVIYELPLTNVRSAGDWQVKTIRIAAVLKFAL